MEGNKQINQSKQTHHKSETKEQQQGAAENRTQHGERWGARSCTAAGAQEQQPPSTPRSRCGHGPQCRGVVDPTRREPNSGARAAGEPRSAPLRRCCCGVRPQGPCPAQPPAPARGRARDNQDMGLLWAFSANTHVGPFCKGSCTSPLCPGVCSSTARPGDPPATSIGSKLPAPSSAFPAPGRDHSWVQSSLALMCSL